MWTLDSTTQCHNHTMFLSSIMHEPNKLEIKRKGFGLSRISDQRNAHLECNRVWSRIITTKQSKPPSPSDRHAERATTTTTTPEATSRSKNKNPYRRHRHPLKTSDRSTKASGTENYSQGLAPALTLLVAGALVDGVALRALGLEDLLAGSWVPRRRLRERRHCCRARSRGDLG